MKTTIQNFLQMKTLKTLLVAFAAMLFCVNVNAQTCDGNTVTFTEDDFMAGSITATESSPTPASIMTNQIDIWDATNGTAGTDGTFDVQLTYEAVVNTPNACASDNFSIGAGWGGTAEQAGGSGSSGDFGGDTNNSCLCQSGYVVVTVDFLGGFSSTAEGFNLAWSSMNGTSEGYEYMFSYVSGGTDANGTALTTLPAVNLANLNTYCNTDYDGGTTMSMHVGATGPGTFSADAPNTAETIRPVTPSSGPFAGMNIFLGNSDPAGSPEETNPDSGPYTNLGTSICGVTDDNGGEDAESGSGPDSGTNAQAVNPNIGLNPTDLITQVTYVYGIHTATGKDCDGDFDQGIDTNPSGSFGPFTVCPPPLPCGFPEPTITLDESCGLFDFNIGAIDETGASGTGTVVTYTTASLNDTYPVVGGTAVTGSEQLTADGTQYYIQICDAADDTCCDEFGPFSVVGNPPVAPVFVPCNGVTTGVGGN